MFAPLVIVNGFREFVQAGCVRGFFVGGCARRSSDRVPRFLTL